MTEPVGFWEHAAADPGRVAVVDVEGAETTFGELAAWSDRLAAGLLERGLGHGDRVAVVLRNHPAFLAVHLAAAQAGLRVVPVNWHLTAAETAYILTDSGATVLVTGTGLTATAGEAADLAGLPADRRFTVGTDLTALEGDGDLDPARRRLGGTMLYTSGTTGRPKGVLKPLPDVNPEQALRARMPATKERFGWPDGRGVHLVVAPLYHAAPIGFCTTALHLGHTVVLMDRWTPEACLDLIQRHRVTGSHMVPTMFHRLLALPEQVRRSYDVSSLDFVIHAAAPCPVHEKHAMIEWFGPVVYEYYSSSEGGGTSIGPHDWLDHPGSVGRAWAAAEIRILDDDGAQLPPGEVGGVYIRNDDPFEYFGDADKTAQSRRGEFFTTGDLGRLDADGYLYLADRRTDLIISGGVNIYPAEVEEVLLAHPAVADVGVIGLPDDDLGRRVHAVVEPAAGVPGGDGLATEILAFAADRLARYKQPRSLEFRTLPRTETGKLSRRTLLADATRLPPPG